MKLRLEYLRRQTTAEFVSLSLYRQDLPDEVQM